MADQQLKVWANTIDIDGLTEAPQRRDILDEEFIDGWLRRESISAQQLNQLFYLLTARSSPVSNPPTMVPDSVTTPTGALEMDGQSITEAAYPNTYALYGGNLPDMSGLHVGFKYIIRGT